MVKLTTLQTIELNHIVYMLYNPKTKQWAKRGSLYRNTTTEFDKASIWTNKKGPAGWISSRSYKHNDVKDFQLISIKINIDALY